MPQSVSEIIYQSFFDRLSRQSEVNSETIEALKSLYTSNQIANRQRLIQLAQQMETRYAQDQDADRS